MLLLVSFLLGSFNNYVDRILPFIDPLPPHLVHVVIECPYKGEMLHSRKENLDLTRLFGSLLYV